MKVLMLYRKGLKNCRDSLEGSSDFLTEVSGSAREHGTNEGQKYEAKPTQDGPKFSVASGMRKLLLCSLFSACCISAAESPTGTKEADFPVFEPTSQQALQIEQTFSIIKPDAIESNIVGEILEYLENAGLKIVASKMVRLTPEQAKAFYTAHKDKAFFKDLIVYMTSGPVILQVLEGEDAIAVNRQIMGATDPGKASPGTIRSDFGIDIERNAVHGSDSPESAKKEIALFFKSDEIFSQAPTAK